MYLSSTLDRCEGPLFVRFRCAELRFHRSVTVEQFSRPRLPSRVTGHRKWMKAFKRPRQISEQKYWAPSGGSSVHGRGKQHTTVAIITSFLVMLQYLTSFCFVFLYTKKVDGFWWCSYRLNEEQGEEETRRRVRCSWMEEHYAQCQKSE